MAAAGETMAKRPRRNHMPAFKAKVALAAVRGEKTIVELVQQLDVASQRDYAMAQSASRWGCGRVRGRGEDHNAGFDGRREDAARQNRELTLESDFLSGALGKAGLLSAKR